MKRDKMDLIWGIEQMEKELAKTHSPASNIMSICTEVLKQTNEKMKIPRCCGKDMLISGDWYHCQNCSNRFIRCLHGEETTILANLIVDYTNENDPSWKELGYIFHELWKQGMYEGYEPDVPDNWNTSIEDAQNASTKSREPSDL